MKNTTSFLSSLALFALFCLILTSCNQGPLDVTSEIAETNNAIMAAYESGDVNGLASFYAADAKLFPANSGVIEGPQAITGFFSAVMNMGIKKIKFEAVSAQSYGNIAIEEGKYTLYAPGDYVADQGKYIVTWKKEEGKWKVHRDIFNTDNPAPLQRASANDTVMMVINNIKAEKVSQFEDYYNNYLALAAAENYGQIKPTVRMQKSLGPNKDGSFTYIFLMDPMNTSFNYDMSIPLIAKYGEEKAAEYGKMYLDCVVDGYPKVIVAQETGW